jgi:hypothetical protein
MAPRYAGRSPPASLGCLQPAASSAASLAPLKVGLSGSPVQVFSQIGWMSTWSPGGTKFAFNPGANTNAEQTNIVDAAGKIVDVVPATWVAWIDDDTYLGIGSETFVGRVGSTAHSPIPGSYDADLSYDPVAAGGVVALLVPPLPSGSFHNAGDEYVIWSAAGITAVRLGHPVAISHDGRFVAVTSRESDQSPLKVELVRADSGKVAASYLDTTTDSNTDPAILGFSPDGTKFAFVTAGGSLVIMEVGSGRPAATAPCEDRWMQPGAWLSGSQLLVNSSKCAAPPDSGVTVTTPQTSVMAVSSDGKIASVSCVANCQAANPTSEVKIEDGRGGQETFAFKGGIMTGHLSWSEDGSRLLIEYADTEVQQPPYGSATMRVVMLRV